MVDGVFSNCVEVTSGMSQGSDLGPLLFLLFINDLPNSLNCNVKLFSDDSAMYCEVGEDEIFYSVALKNDLNALNVWCTTWQLNLTKDK